MERIGDSKSIKLRYLWHLNEYPSNSGATIPHHIAEHLFGYMDDKDYYLIDPNHSTIELYAEYLKSLDIDSCLIFPVKMHNRIYGFIGIDQCCGDHIWQPREVFILNQVSELISHAVIQKMTLRELHHTNAILNKVLDSIHAIIVVIDINTNRILYLNQFARNIFGNVEGKFCWEQLHGDLKTMCENCPRPGVGEYKDQKVVIKEIQNSYWKRWYHTTNTIIDWIDGKKAHLEIAIDITDRVETEERMRMTATSLEDLNHTKDKFFSIVAHDLKNPLYSLMGFAELIRNSAHQLSSNEIEEYSDLIYQSARNTHQLLQNLMTWSQSQTGKLRFNPSQVDITHLLDNAIEFVKPVAKQKNITLTHHYEISRALNIDPNMITAAVRNLLSNAVKFTPPDGQIKIGYFKDEEQYCIAIEDNGIGLSESDINKLFRIDIDHRSIGSTYTDAKGTGLGLILVKEFVHQHGGNIKVQSTEGQGSTFIICLPQSLALD